MSLNLTENGIFYLREAFLWPRICRKCVCGRAFAPDQIPLGNSWRSSKPPSRLGEDTLPKPHPAKYGIYKFCIRIWPMICRICLRQATNIITGSVVYAAELNWNDFFVLRKSIRWPKICRKFVFVSGRGSAPHPTGELRTLPTPPCQLGRGHPSPDLTQLGAFGGWLRLGRRNWIHGQLSVRLFQYLCSGVTACRCNCDELHTAWKWIQCAKC